LGFRREADHLTPYKNESRKHQREILNQLVTKSA